MTDSLCQAHCPLCGEVNECAVEKGGDSGRCWCREETFPLGLEESLPVEVSRMICLCRRCVVKARRAEAKALPWLEPQPGDFYSENGLMVFTEDYLRRKGYCCGGGCRHCPYDAFEREIAFCKT